MRHLAWGKALGSKEKRLEIWISKEEKKLHRNRLIYLGLGRNGVCVGACSMCMCVYVCACTCARVLVYVHVTVHMCTCICVHVGVCMCVHCVCVHT